MRAGLAREFLKKDPPQLLILDEPTAGIDPIQVAQTRDLIRELGRDRTILLSTHILPEVSMICDRVIIIHQGKIVAEDRIENLSNFLDGDKRLRLTVHGPADEVTAGLQRLDAISDVIYAEPYHIVDYPADEEPQAEITKAMVENGWTLLAMEPSVMSLEDIFLQLTTEDEADR